MWLKRIRRFSTTVIVLLATIVTIWFSQVNVAYAWEYASPDAIIMNVTPVQLTSPLKVHDGWTMKNYVNQSSNWSFGINNGSDTSITMNQNTDYYSGNPIVWFYAKNTIMVFPANMNKVVSLGENGGVHFYSHALNKGDEIPVQYWAASESPLASHSEGFGVEDMTTAGEGLYIYKGFPFRAAAATGVPCSRKGDSTAWHPTCALCGETIRFNFYGNHLAVAEMPTLTTGATYIYTCRVCGGLEQGAAISHTCKRVSSNQYNLNYDKNTKDPNSYGTTSPQVVFYHQDGTTGKAEFDRLEVTGDLNARESEFVRPGYVFTGWNTKPDGSGVTVNAGQSLAYFYNNADTVKNVEGIATYKNESAGVYDITLYAQWEANTSYLKIDANTNAFGGGAKYNGHEIWVSEETPYQMMSEQDGADKGSANGYAASTYKVDGSITPPKGYTADFVVKEIIAESITANTSFVDFSIGEDFNGYFDTETKTYTFGQEKRTKERADVLTLGYKQDDITLPGAPDSSTESFVGWYTDENFTQYAGEEGDSYSLSENTTFYARYASMNVDVTDAYFKKKTTTDGFDNVVRNDQGKAVNDAATPSAASAVQNATGAINLAMNMFTPNSWHTLYKPQWKYNTEGDTAWKDFNALNGANNSTSVNDYNATYNKGSYTYKVQSSGLYKLDAFGAQGGNYGSYKGGLGGEAYGTFYLTEGDELTITVGGQNGYNGGGSASSFGNGGGYTIVKSKKLGTLLIAGGGGGASNAQAGGAGGLTTSLRPDQTASTNGNSGINSVSGGGGGYKGGNVNYTNASATKTFAYTGSYQSFTAPADGTYTLEAWGAQGGNVINAFRTGVTVTGGLGGYSAGKITLKAGETIYITVGGQGASSNQTVSLKEYGRNDDGDREWLAYIRGGYNGGGHNIFFSTSSTIQGAGGGGATSFTKTLRSGVVTDYYIPETSVRTATGELQLYENYKNEVLLVGGGGGGASAGKKEDDVCTFAYGGTGGGIKGGMGGTGFNPYRGGLGGTQTAPAPTAGESWNYVNGVSYYRKAAFGYGGSIEGNSSSWDHAVTVGAGGAGWYGGAAGNTYTAGGGGSGYIGGVTSGSTQNGRQSGNGKAVVSYQIMVVSGSYGGSNYINTVSAQTSTTGNLSGKKTGDGQVKITGVVLNLSDGKDNYAELLGAPFPDTAAPGSVGELQADATSGAQVLSWEEPNSNGTVYDFRVQLYELPTSGSNVDLKQTSDVFSRTLESAVAGYYYIYNNEAGTNLANYINSRYKKPAYTWDNQHYSDALTGFVQIPSLAVNTTARYIHVAAVDVAGNIGPTSTKEVAKTNLCTVTFHTNHLKFQLSPASSVDSGTWDVYGRTDSVSAIGENKQNAYYRGYYAVDGSNQTGDCGTLNGQDIGLHFGGEFPIPAATGCTFVGWNTKADGTGTYYSANGDNIGVSDEVDKMLVLFDLTGSHVPSPCMDTINNLGHVLASELQLETNKEVPVVELQRMLDTTERNVQEEVPLFTASERAERERFLNKLYNRLQDIFYEHEFILNDRRLTFTETNGNVVLPCDQLYQMYTQYQEEKVKNPAKKVAKYAEQQYDEYMER